MGRRLYATEKVFKETILQLDSMYQPISGKSLLTEVGVFKPQEQGKDTSELEGIIDDIEISMPTVFFFQVAIYHLWLSWGIKPDIVIGQSLGEVAAAYACGAITLKEACFTVYYWAFHQAKLKGMGTIAALDRSNEDAKALLASYQSGSIFVAAFNAPGSVIVSGDVKVVRDVVANNQTIAKELRVPYAFHTPHLEPIRAGLQKDMENKIRTPTGVHAVPFYSTVTGKRYNGDLGFDYWVKNIVSPVLFMPAIESILKETGAVVFLECASSVTLAPYIDEIAQHACSERKVVTISCGFREKDDRVSVLRALGSLYCTGVDIDWKIVNNGICELPCTSPQ